MRLTAPWLGSRDGSVHPFSGYSGLPVQPPEPFLGLERVGGPQLGRVHSSGRAGLPPSAAAMASPPSPLCCWSPLGTQRNDPIRQEML